MTFRLSPIALVVALALAGCSGETAGDDPAVSSAQNAAEGTTISAGSPGTTDGPEAPLTEAPTTVEVAAGPSTDAETVSASFEIEIWADNWSAVYVDGVLVGEDSVSITTERSFNAETFTFTATYPFTVAIEAKDFKETDSGLEYIGENNQQMGDGGLIAQITDSATGKVVAVTNASWQTLVVHRAPLNTDCEKSADPDTDCRFETFEVPADWASPTFDDSTWTAATTWTAADVSPKDGYDEIDWDGSAELIWGADLEVDNTVLLRLTVAG